MSTHQDDLDLLLSLQERVPDTPPASPSSTHAHPSGYLSDHGSPSSNCKADMSAFRESVKDYLLDEPSTTQVATKLKSSKRSNNIEVEKFSGLRIRDLLLSSADLCNRFSDIRFIQLQAIGNMLTGDTISGCWATVGVLTEKGNPKMSSTGKNFGVWKMGCLNESTVSVFLFNDAYGRNLEEPVGSVFALFNSNIRKDDQGKGFSLSVYSAGQIVKLGTSVDYGVCKGKRKDGMACTMVINKRHGVYCKFHVSTASQKYLTSRAELKGGNIKRAFTPFRNHLKSEGIYLVDPMADRRNLTKRVQPAKVLSVDGLRKALRRQDPLIEGYYHDGNYGSYPINNAAQVTTTSQSQGIRFLKEVTGKMLPKDSIKASTKHVLQDGNTSKRLPCGTKADSKIAMANKQPEAKRLKTQSQPISGNLIELDIVSSDEEW